jgi:hypothetical protein
MDSHSTAPGVLRTKGNEVDHCTFAVDGGFGVGISMIQTSNGEMANVHDNGWQNNYLADIYIGGAWQTFNISITSNLLTTGVLPTTANYGVWFNAAGSAVMTNNDCEWNAFACIYNTNTFAAGSGRVKVEGNVSEEEPFFLYSHVGGSGAVQSSFNISSSRIADQPGDNGYVIVAGPGLTMIGNSICAFENNQCKLDIGGNDSQSFVTAQDVFIGNSYNKALSPTGGGGYTATVGGAPFTDDVGDAGAIVSYVEIGDAIMDTVGSSYVQIPNVTHGMSVGLGDSTYANLTTVLTTNGLSTFCSDCDPPANPPVACTNAGAKTGAMVSRLNGTNICHY